MLRLKVLALVVCIVVELVCCDEPDLDINHANVNKYVREAAPGGAQKEVTVHVVPHTHDDVGWLKTVDQYYYGTREDIYKGGVQYILDTVVEELVRDKNKKFIYVEIAFFKRWWEEQNNATKVTVKGLVKDRQLEFINAGYCMNDEASVHYTATIDQMSEGLRWLEAELGGEGYDVAPRVAWQIDPFGHSSAHAALSAQMGLEGLFFARMHYQDYDKRKQNKDLEYSWRAEGVDLFTGVLYRHYNAPPGFNFDRRGVDPPMVVNGQSPEYNLPERVTDFLGYLEEQASHYRSGNIMLTMGGDFCYQNARKYFKNLDILMDYINSNTTNGFKMIYSTPSIYMDAVKKSKIDLKEKTDDLFPYADGPHAYWTGYFTSRPTLKGYVRDCNNILQTCKQLESASALSGTKLGVTSAKLRLAMGVAQHHDAVSGTSKQHVADDYARRLAEGQTDCEELINKGLKSQSVFTGTLYSCRLLNESMCEATSDGNRSFTVVIYNSRMVGRMEYIRVPLQHPHYRIKNLSTQQYIYSEFIRVSQATQNINPNAAPLEVVFGASLPPLGYSSFLIEYTLDYVGVVLRGLPRQYADITVETTIYKVVFDGRTGAMKQITSKLSGLSGKSEQITQRFMQYKSSLGTPDAKQPSGAYIFRPNGTAVDLGEPVLTNYIPGELCTEIWQNFGDWVSQVTRVYEDKFYIEVEWTVGPIPLDYGREIITRYETGLETNKTFYTDSNGREMVTRVLNKQPTWDLNVTEPVAGNYYPVNTRATLVDPTKQMHLTVLTDRSQGAASLQDGQVEFMVHRRILKDDRRGVAEALNETANGRGLIARGKHWLFYSDSLSYNIHRALGMDLFYRPTLSFGPVGQLEIPQWSFLAESLNLNEFLNLVTVQRISNTELLVRLENTLRTEEGGKPMSVDLGKLFGVQGTLAGFKELMLGGDRPVKEVHQTTHTVVTLKPFEIKTFVLSFNTNTF